MSWMWESAVLPGKGQDSVFMELCPWSVGSTEGQHCSPSGNGWVRDVREWAFLADQLTVLLCVDELIPFFWFSKKTFLWCPWTSLGTGDWADAALCLHSQAWDWQQWFCPSGWTSTTSSSSPGLSTTCSTPSLRWVPGCLQPPPARGRGPHSPYGQWFVCDPQGLYLLLFVLRALVSTGPFLRRFISPAGTSVVVVLWREWSPLQELFPTHFSLSNSPCVFWWFFSRAARIWAAHFQNWFCHIMVLFLRTYSLS